MAKQVADADQGTDTLDVNTGAAAILGLLSDDLDTADEADEQVEGGEGEDDPQDDAEGDDGSDDVQDDDESDEDDLDDESDDEVDDEADDAPEDSDSPPTHKVKVDGEEFEVTLDEALAGYQRQQAFTKRMQALAEERNALNEESQSVAQARQEYLDRLDLVEKALTGTANEPNWEQLKSQDPKKYTDARIAWQERKEQLETLRTEQQRVRDEQRSSFEAERQRVLQIEAERLEAAVPEWATDPDVKRDEQKKIVQFAQTTYGFTPDDLGSVADHRVILLLRDAMKYRDLQEQGSKAKDVAREKRRKSPTLQPGNPKTKATKKATSRKNSARKKLAQTGRIDDAAAALFDMISD